MYLLYVLYATEHTRVTLPNMDCFLTFKSGYFENLILCNNTDGEPRNDAIQEHQVSPCIFRQTKSDEKGIFQRFSRPDGSAFYTVSAGTLFFL